MKLKWLNLKDTTLADSLLLESAEGQGEARMREIKAKALKRFGIELGPDEGPLDAWLLEMCRLNGLDAKLPVPDALSQVIFSNASVMRFVFWLAG